MLYLLLDMLRDWLVEVGLYRWVRVLDQLEFRSFAAGLAALAIVLGAGKPVVRWLAAKKIGDAARFDVESLDRALASKANTPTMGGLLIAGAIIASTLLFADLTNRYVQMGLIVTIWMAALGGADDWLKLTAASRPGGSRQGLHAWEKLIFQLGLGFLIGWFAFNYADAPPRLGHALNIPFQRTFQPGTGELNESLILLPKAAFIVIAMLMISGMSNAVNITDGMDGLASGTTAFVSLGLIVLCFIAGREAAAQGLLVPYVLGSDELMIVASALAGACFGFLWWNCAPAIVFMGDTGALCLGGLLGYIALVIRQEALVLIMGGVFVFELASVMLQVGWFKITAKTRGQGQRIFRCAPFHWHLHMGGWAEQKIVVRLWIVSAILTAVALASIKLR